VGSVTQMPTLLLDLNGIPRGHFEARDRAAKALMDWVNDLPSSCYHLGLDDAEDVANVMLATYIGTLKQAQR